MAPVTYIASSEKENVFLLNSFTYIASNHESFYETFFETEVQTKTIPELPTEVPAFIFSQGLSALESISKYLKEEKNLRLCEIASLLNRDDRTIWNAYNEASKKAALSDISYSEDLENAVMIPLSIFSDRILSMLESVACFLKEECGKRYCDIASILGKDARTIWTVCNRAQKKRKKIVNENNS